MARGKTSIFFYTIISLAIIGILTKIISNPVAIFKNIFVILGVIILILAVGYFVFNRNSTKSNSEMKKYKQAVKQSKVKYQHHNRSYNPRIQQPSKKSKRPSHLKVIDGKKSKNNDHANF